MRTTRLILCVIALVACVLARADAHNSANVRPPAPTPGGRPTPEAEATKAVIDKEVSKVGTLIVEKMERIAQGLDPINRGQAHFGYTGEVRRPTLDENAMAAQPIRSEYAKPAGNSTTPAPK